jgi:diacylglycerol kinase (ATP)
MRGAWGDGVVVFLNPRSRANRRNPRLAGELAAAIGDAGRVVAPSSLEQLRELAVTLRATPPAAVAVHGGDGTLHKVVTALGAAFGEEPLPPLALLPGGTMNVVAASLHLGREPKVFLRELADDLGAGRPLDLLPRRCLRIEDGARTHLGFVFGNGLAANFLGEYYVDDAYGPRRAAWMLFRILISAFVGGPYVRRMFKRFEGRVRVDGELLQRTRFVGVNAATVREVGLGFKLNHRADDDPERFGVLAIHAPPLALVPDLAAVHAGRGVGPARAFSAVASTLEISPMSPPDGSPTTEMSYTIDGDLYRTSAVGLRITVGPAVHFVRPRGSAAVAALPRAPTVSALPPSTSGDTMGQAR